MGLKSSSELPGKLGSGCLDYYIVSKKEVAQVKRKYTKREGLIGRREYDNKSHRRVRGSKLKMCAMYYKRGPLYPIR